MLDAHFKKAFSMLELIFVIVILGIVSSIGSQIIVQVYESYLMQSAVHNASIKTELAINQLSNRLNYRIDNSMLARKTGQTGTTVGVDIHPAGQVPLDETAHYPILEWINYDNDSFIFRKGSAAGWSGFVDLGNTTQTKFASIYTPGSSLNYIKPIIKHYTGTSDGTGGAIIFLGNGTYKDDGAGNTASYAAPCMYSNDGCIFPVEVSNGVKFKFKTAGAGDRAYGEMVYSEFYQYATSAFAVVPERDHTVGDLGSNGGSMITPSTEVWDLRFYYAYQPWKNDNYLDGKSSILLKNVSVFRFSKETNAIRLKICSVERIGDEDQISICKEKAVIR